jgi:dienelactone hydrolase
MKTKLIMALIASMILGGQTLPAKAKAKNTGPTPTTEQQTVTQSAQSGDTVLLDATAYRLPRQISAYQWQQISGPSVEIVNPLAPKAYFVAPILSATQPAQTISLQLTVIDKFRNLYQFGHQVDVLAPQPDEPPVIVTLRNDNEILIPAKYHPLGNELVAVLHLPKTASAENPVPGCAIVHGSGGLFQENAAGQVCSSELETTYQNLANQLKGQGIAAILPSSFYSRDNRFCEDNDDNDAYLPFAGEPFFNGNDPVARDDSYKIRRVAIRTMDMLATMNFFCDLAEVDCSKSCMIGTSNGATSIMAYSAQSLPTDLQAFMDDAKRPFEYNSTHQKRLTAFENFPPLTVSPITLTHQLTHRPLPKFAQLVSPGCTMRDMVPDIVPGEEELPFGLDELYYPAGDTELTFEVGTADSTPKECYTAAPQGDGLREVQARHFEQASNIAPQDSRYIIEVHQEGPHSLLSDDNYKDIILNRLDDLIFTHLQQ